MPNSLLSLIFIDDQMGNLLIGAGIVIVIILAAICLLYFANWYIYQQREMYTGTVSSYYCTRDFLGVLNCQLILGYGQNLTWSSWSTLPLGYVGNDIKAQPGELKKL
jgi:hypothetical protein